MSLGGAWVGVLAVLKFVVLAALLAGVVGVLWGGALGLRELHAMWERKWPKRPKRTFWQSFRFIVTGVLVGAALLGVAGLIHSIRQ